MAYSTVLLDLDHTLLDSDTSLTMAFADAMHSVGADPTDRYSIFDDINRALWRRVEAGDITARQVHVARFATLNETLDLQANPQVMADAFANGMGEHGELYDGAIEMLDALAEVATLAMVTNGLSDVQRRRAERTGIAGYFETLTISAEHDTAKPGTEIFEITFASLGHPPRDQALMVGDNLGSDIAGGNNYGIATCWYNPHARPADAAHLATHTIANLSELVTIVQGCPVSSVSH